MTPAMSQAMTAAVATTLNQVASTNDATQVGSPFAFAR